VAIHHDENDDGKMNERLFNDGRLELPHRLLAAVGFEQKVFKAEVGQRVDRKH